MADEVNLFPRCTRCERLAYKGECGCKIFEFWIPEIGYGLENSPISRYSRQLLVDKIAEEVCGQICQDDCDLYRNFIDRTVTVFIKQDEVIHKFDVSAEETILFSARDKD